MRSRVATLGRASIALLSRAAFGLLLACTLELAIEDALTNDSATGGEIPQTFKFVIVEGRSEGNPHESFGASCGAFCNAASAARASSFSS